MKISKKNKIILFITIAVLSISTFIVYTNSNDKIEEISYTLFLTHIERGIVEEVKLSDEDKLEVKLDKGNIVIVDNPRTENFKEKLLLQDIKVVEGSDYSSSVLPFILFVFIIGSIAYYLNNGSSKQAEKEMSTLSDMEIPDRPQDRIRFSDVAGNEEAKESLADLVDFIKNPEIYNNYGARLPRGILLYGEPGTGKTLLAKALAGEADVPFYAVSGSDFVQVYAGLGASRIRGLFKKAKQMGKSVIFIDEIDSLGKKRKSSSNPSGSEEGDRTLNALLTEMSGFNENDGIIVVAATNRIDILDEALLRPGRFDRQVEVSLPDINGREKILKLHSKNKPMAKNIDFNKLALETVYFSGSKLENLLNESAILAVKDNSSEITKKHIDRAYYSVLVGDEKKDRTGINKTDKQTTAYHEAGHALVAKLVGEETRVTKISIIPSTKGMGGFSLNIPIEKMYQSKTDLKNNIMTSLGGRAAEELIFGKEFVTTGASSDLEKATEMILSMIGIFGMDSELGLLNYNLLNTKNIDTGNKLFNRSVNILDEFYDETINIIKQNIHILKELANKLMDCEVLYEDEINNIILKQNRLL